MAAHFHEQDIRSGLKDRRRLSVFLTDLVQRHQPGVKRVQLDYIFCTDRFLLDMNQQFLDHDTYTDIITFDLGEDSAVLIGEIYISIERVRDNAATYKVPVSTELHRVIFHGALHLCGYKDKSVAQKKQMRQMEDECLAAYGA